MLRYDRADIDWLVCYAQELREGRWPDPIPSGYVDPGGKHHLNKRAPFENPCLAIAELEIRVKRCGLDGFLVEERLNGKDEEQIARERYMPLEVVERRINKVLCYCASGNAARWVTTRKRRGLSYEEWQKHWNWNKYNQS